MLTCGNVREVLYKCLLTPEEAEPITSLVDQLMADRPSEVNVLDSAMAYSMEQLQSLSDAGKTPFPLVAVQGVLNNFVFHRERLESHREAVYQLLEELPDNFRQSVGGGWSFLNMCVDRDGNHWAEHVNVEQLIVLGVGLDLMDFLPSQKHRNLWKAFPGGMPYLVFKDRLPVPEAQKPDESENLSVRADSI